MDETGKPLYFNLQTHIAAIVGMIQSDELQIALQMCDQVPGFYRDNYPPELSEIKRTLYRQTYDQIEYATDDEEAECTREFGEAQWDNGYMYPRAEVVAKLVKELNTQELDPWIFDLGCSHGNLPLGLLKEKLRFTYRGAGMNWRIQEKVKDWLGNYWQHKPAKEGESLTLTGDGFEKLPAQPTILYCTEVIEHCFNPHDIVHSAHKVGVAFDHIILSVPKYTLGGGLPDWQTRRLGHVRTWTPKEFIRFADESFPGYTWQLFDAYSMVLQGAKK
jgi:hypothetical protein